MRKSTPKIPYDDPLRHRKTPREMLKEPISTECEACRDNIIQVRRDTIAVIFVPGIMGSKLKDPKNAPVWNPDSRSFMAGLYMMHAFSRAAEGDRQKLGLLQTVVWLGPEDDPQATTEGHPWRDYTYAQTTTVHQTDDLDYGPILPSGKGGRP